MQFNWFGMSPSLLGIHAEDLTCFVVCTRLVGTKNHFLCLLASLTHSLSYLTNLRTFSSILSVKLANSEPKKEVLTSAKKATVDYIKNKWFFVKYQDRNFSQLGKSHHIILGYDHIKSIL